MRCLGELVGVNKAPHDSTLAAPCPQVERPPAADYDVWQAWINKLLHQYPECAARHVKTVQALPK